METPVDEIHAEPVDSGKAVCPRCGSKLIDYVFTKRGISIKCQICSFDTHFIKDVLSHRMKEVEALPYLKAIAPDLNFLENVDYGWDFIIEPEKEDQHLIYDAKVFFGGYKLERLKICIVQNTTYANYVQADENYLQGRQEVFDKLVKSDALMVFYFPQDPEVKIALAYCRDLRDYAKEVIDRFKNKQYSIPKEVRRTLMVSSKERIREILHRNLFKRIFEKRYVV